MPSPFPIGAFTPGVARLVQPGAVEYDDGDIPKSVTDTWGVILARGMRPGALSTISGLPAAGSAHGTFPYLVRAGITIRNAVEMAGSIVWMIDVAYAPQGASSSVTNPDDDPERPGVASVVRVVEKAWPIYETQVDFVADADTGDLVLNSAGEPFDRVPQISRRYMGARIKRAEQNWPKLAASLDGTLNDDDVTVLGVKFPKHSARLQIEIEDTLAVGSDTRYLVTYDLVPCHNVYGQDGGGDPEDAGWDIPLVEQGFSCLESGELVRATVPDANGVDTPTALPVLLDANGARLSAGADPVVRVWHAYVEADWTDLDLPEKPTDDDPPEPEP